MFTIAVHAHSLIPKEEGILCAHDIEASKQVFLVKAMFLQHV